MSDNDDERPYDHEWKTLSGSEPLQLILDADDDLKSWKKKVRGNIFGGGVPGCMLVLISLLATIAALALYAYSMIASVTSDTEANAPGRLGMGTFLVALPFVLIGIGVFHLLAPMFFRIYKNTKDI